VAVEVVPEFDCGGDCDEKAEIAKADMNFFELRGLGFTSALELFVLLCRRGGCGGMHVGIISHG
jgi:hypothetical protein